MDNITKVDADFAFRMFALTEAAKGVAAIDEIEELFAIREKVNEHVELRENGSIFAKLRLVLNYTASTSRVFWPASKKASVVARCERMRSLVGIPDNHALSNRTLRNHIEHFDERLDEWMDTSPRPFTGFEIAVHRDYNDMTVEPLLISVPVLFFEENLEIRLFGHTYALSELRAALVDIRDRISESYKLDFA